MILKGLFADIQVTPKKEVTIPTKQISCRDAFTFS